MTVIMPFGHHKGQKIEDIPVHYLEWVVDPEGKRTPIDPEIVAEAQRVMEMKKAEEAKAIFAQKCLAGNPTGHETPIYIIDSYEEPYTKSGTGFINDKWFASLDDALAFLASEYPLEAEEYEDAVSRHTPDPEDDMIQIYEVLPTGHKKAVWGFYGWHHSHDLEMSPCGQGTLPGDEQDLYTLAMIDY